jgi:LmbE family N-acetylglucosaminyl deacetylase
MDIVVAAHPDDDVIGLGAHLPCLRNAIFVYVTDGAPRNMVDAAANGFSSREGYALARKKELHEALGLAGIGTAQCRHLGVADQEASFYVRELALAFSDLFSELKPRYVLTHPYEGGHPDHDAAAFACHAARRLLMRRGACPGILIEFTSYHTRPDGLRVTEEFLPPADAQITMKLDAAQRLFKKNLLACFHTQRGVVSEFPLETEKFRVAPDYDFCSPPHDGPLHYERYPWGISAPEWRGNARVALEELGL